MPDSDSLDRDIRAANFVPQDAPAQPINDLLSRLEDPRPLRTRMRRRTPLLAAAVALAVSGTAAATVAVLDRTGPSTELEAAAVPDSAAGKRLTGLFSPSGGSKLTDGRRAFPELGDAGPVTGITVRRDEFDVDVAQDGAKVCFGGHMPGERTFGAACANLPIPYDMIPLGGGGTVDPPRSIWVSVAPDGVRDLTVTTKDGQTRTAPYIDNVAAITFDGRADMSNYSWTLPNGERQSFRP